MLDSTLEEIPEYRSYSNDILYSWMGLTKDEYDFHQARLLIKRDSIEIKKLKVIEGKKLLKQLWIYSRLFQKTDKGLMSMHIWIHALTAYIEELEKF